MRPQVQPGNFVTLAEPQRYIAATLAVESQVRGLDATQRQVETQGQDNADAHDHATVSQGVGGGLDSQPGQAGDRTKTDQRQGQRPNHGRQKL